MREYLFKDLRLEFEDGRVTEFSCGNFDSGKELVKQVILNGHSWLPLGEFAIGTNTAAYAMAKKYNIGSRQGLTLQWEIPATALPRIHPCTILTEKK